jgi:hypothetical protein
MTCILSAGLALTVFSVLYRNRLNRNSGYTEIYPENLDLLYGIRNFPSYRNTEHLF